MSLENPLFGSPEGLHDAVEDPQKIEPVSDLSIELEDKVHRELGSETFEYKPVVELFADGKRRQEKVWNFFSAFKSKTAEQAGTSYVRAAFRAAKKPLNWTAKKTAQVIFSAPELAEYSMEAFRHKGSIMKNLGIDIYETVAHDSDIIQLGLGEIPFAKDNAQRVNDIGERSAQASVEAIDQLSQLDRDIEQELKMNEKLKILFELKNENKRLREQIEAAA